MTTPSRLIGAGLSVVLVTCSHSLSPSHLSSDWPNEPAGMTVLSDWGLDREPPTAGLGALLARRHGLLTCGWPAEEQGRGQYQHSEEDRQSTGAPSGGR